MLSGPLAYAAATTGLAGTIINAHWRNRWCFAFWLCSNIAWLVSAVADGAWPLAGQMAIYACISIDGWFRWGQLAAADAPSSKEETDDA